MPIPGQDLATRQLTRTEITQVLQGIVDTPEPSIYPSVTACAFWCTLNSMLSWCDPAMLEDVCADVINKAGVRALTVPVRVTA